MQRILPKGGAWGFFGWHLVKKRSKEIIITEGEYDAMATYQALNDLPKSSPYSELKNIAVVSLPNGCNSFPSELVTLCNNFDKIYLWLDYDKSGQESCEKFAKKLGVHKTFLIKPDPSMIVRNLFFF